jgi:flagellar protein FlbD
MIHLTRLNSQPIAVNSDLIKFVESAHDTVLTLLNGEKVVVREQPEEVIQRIIEFRRSVLAGLPSLNPQGSAVAFMKPDSATNDSSSEKARRG